jgi:hypothetical protein
MPEQPEGLSLKDAEIIKLREQIEMLQNQLTLTTPIIDKYNDPVAELEIDLGMKLISLSDEITISPLVDSYNAIMQDIKDDQEWINEYMQQMKKPKKKKVDKEKMKKDLFEIDFMCD